MQKPNRRHFVVGGLAATLGCSRLDRRSGITSSLPSSRVSIIRAASYNADLVDIIRRVLIDHRVAIKGKNVLLKPNLVEFSPQTPVNTNPVFVAAALEAFQSLGAKTVGIAEGPGHRRMTLDMADAAGFFQAIPKFEDNFTDLNIDSVHPVCLSKPFSTLSELYLPQTVLACDLLVSLPKMKTHHWTGATLAMKNLFGVIPGSIYGWPKNVLHWAGIDESVADLQQLFLRQFCLVDGIEGMEGNGPILGNSKASGVIVAGADPPSVDATCCRIMKIDPAKVRYLQLAGSRSRFNVMSPSQTGETIRSVATRFALHPDLEGLRLNTET